jgi:hypothetical protein
MTLLPIPAHLRFWVNTVELVYNVMKETEYCVVITEEYNVTVNSEEFIGTTDT